MVGGVEGVTRAAATGAGDAFNVFFDAATIEPDTLIERVTRLADTVLPGHYFDERGSVKPTAPPTRRPLQRVLARFRSLGNF
jgi:hypothetical protein